MRLPVLIPTLLLLPLSLGFSFTLNSTAVSQCGITSVHWSGGTPPFYLTVIVGLRSTRLYLLLRRRFCLVSRLRLASSSRAAFAPLSRVPILLRLLWSNRSCGLGGPVALDESG
jgi:hypothetical protein